MQTTLVQLNGVLKGYQDEKFLETEANAKSAAVAMVDTVNQLRALNKKVVVIAPPPSLDFNIGDCLDGICQRSW